MTGSKAARARKTTSGPRPVTVTLHRPLLDAVRAAYPTARTWTDNQIAAACVAMALTRTPPRNGLVHTD